MDLVGCSTEMPMRWMKVALSWQITYFDVLPFSDAFLSYSITACYAVQTGLFTD